MRQIRVESDVYLGILLHLEPGNANVSELLRRMLLVYDASLSAESSKPHRKNELITPSPWKTNGTSFDHDTVFQGLHNGRTYLARVVNGELVYNHQTYTSLSSLASRIRGYREDGWRFFTVRLPGKSKFQSLLTWPRNTKPVS